MWWNNFVSWLIAVSNQPVVFGAVVLVVAIIVASVLSAWISRGAIRGLLNQRDRELKSAVISALVDAATEASVWNSLTPQEQVMADRAVGHADIQLRLLPIKGAGIAANWAAHQLGDLKRTSATFGYQLEPAVVEFRDRLVEWQNRPSRARKIFQADLDRWKLQNTSSEKSLLAEQDAWVAQQHHDDFTRLESEYASAPRTPDRTPQDLVSATAAQDHAAHDIAAQGSRAPISYAPLGYAPAAPGAETQRLLDDVQALEVRPFEPVAGTEPLGGAEPLSGAEPLGGAEASNGAEATTGTGPVPTS